MVVTRFAPSPTGYLHIGGLRTALFNYLWARKNNGRFLLRIEDTDLERNSDDAVRAILEAFSWSRLDYDGEAIFQSKRFDIYKSYIKRLLDEKKAYYCYMTKEELDALREEQIKRGERPRYDNRYRDFNGTPPSGIEPVVRIKAPLSGTIKFVDGIKGEIEIDANEIDDFIIARSNGVPTYNFVVAIDDYEMGITDVIRGDDHLMNTPKQIIIYEALGIKPPKFFHVPMILNPEGKKLSKRDGAMDVMEYQREGFLPEALLNFLVRLGWSHGDQEIFSMDEMIVLFDPKDINKSASAYNYEKLLWLNSHYIKNLSNERLSGELERYNIYLASHDKKEILLDVLKERAKTIKELAELIKEILSTPNEYDQKWISKNLDQTTIQMLEAFIKELKNTQEILHLPIDFEQLSNRFMQEHSLKMPKFAQPIRVALIGKSAGIPIYDIMAIIGKNETINRIKEAIEVFKNCLQD